MLFVIIFLFIAINEVIKKIYIEELGNGYYLYQSDFNILKSRIDDKVNIIDILEKEYDDKYIITIRIPVRAFYGEENCTIFSDHTLRYLIINKQSNKIYETDSYLKFKHKVKNLNVNLMFSNQALEQSKKKFEKNRHLYKNTKTLEYLENKCKEDFIYPIEEY